MLETERKKRTGSALQQSTLSLSLGRYADGRQAAPRQYDHGQQTAEPLTTRGPHRSHHLAMRLIL